MNDYIDHTHDESSSGHGGSPGSAAPHDHKEDGRQYFLPGKIILQFANTAGINEVKLAEVISRTVEELGEGYVKSVDPCAILNFPSGADQGSGLSIVPVELTSTSQENLIKALLQIYNRLREQPVDLAEGVSLKSVSPNWLLGSAVHGAHPPSPGSWPVPPAATVKNWNFSLVTKDSNASRELPFAEEAGANVHVAILDTAPSALDLEEAYERWQNTNDLIKRLLDPTGKLRVIREIYADIELLDYSLEGHRYWMADHGLFIAGEIDSIAPEAMKHLIKVFTSYGSASTETIAQGILRILTDPEIGRPLIVNCSFGLAAPVPGHDDPNFPVALRDPATLEHMQTSLRALFDQLTSQNEVIVVASAGDDTDLENAPRVPARLPAAYENVIGVGAVPKDLPPGNGPYQAASYSNLADNPPDTGFVTVGGEPGRGRGVLGIFTSELPNFHPKQGENWPGPGHLPPSPPPLMRDRIGYKRNQKGLVEWAGASFAAPIITGILANWCSEQVSARALGQPFQDITLANARQALTGMSEGTTDANEHVILVTQG
jgi:hypothetical protein